MSTDDLRQQANLWPELFGELQGCLRGLRNSLRTASLQWDLSDSEAVLLLCCYQSDPHGIAQQYLVQMLGMSPAQVSTQIESLHRRGLVIGHRSPRDRRQQVWRVCPEEGEQVRQFCHALVRLGESVIAAIPGAELHQTIQQLQGLRQSLDASARKPAGDGMAPPAGDREVAA